MGARRPADDLALTRPDQAQPTSPAFIHDLARGSARQLGWMRVVVCAVVLLSADVHRAVAVADHLATVPPSALRPPLGGEWLTMGLSAAPVLARIAWTAVVGGALLGLLGVVARPALAAATVGSVYLLGLLQLGGGPAHTHHLVWLLALLAASPCADALTVRDWTGDARGPRYDVGVLAMWTVLGCVYLFPGLHKLAGDWVTGDALQQSLWWKWAQSPDFVPWVRPESPAVLRAASVGVVGFEIAFLPAVLWSRTRPYAVAAALLFHAGTAWVANIRFSSLWVLLLMAIPVDRDAEARSGRVPSIPAVALLVPIAIAGVLRWEHAWPFACYPTFASAPGTSMPTVEAVAGDRVLDLLAGSPDPQRTLGELWTLRAHPEGIAAWWDRERERLSPQLGDAVPVRFYAGERSVVPGDDSAPTLGRLLATVPDR